MENDLISRQAAIDAIERHLHIVLDGTHYDEGIAFGYEAAHRHIIDVIHDLSSAQRKGKWKHEKMKHIINGEVRDVMICSVCDAGWFRYDISDNTVRCVPNFCPNCGAEMRGDDDGT